MAYDIVIKNGTVVDGSGQPPLQADVAIQGDRIAAVGKVTERAEHGCQFAHLLSHLLGT